MFCESLLDSSPQSRKGKRWPMALAFVCELIAGTLLVVIPLLTTGVIHVSAHVVRYAPLGNVHAATEKAAQHSQASKGIQLRPAVVTFNNHSGHIINANSVQSGSSISDPQLTIVGSLEGIKGPFIPAVQPKPSRRPIVSNLSEAQLLNRVDPVYPRIAALTQRQGEVKLHAFISKDGRIESLTVISGDPMFVNPAVVAVRQWRYRPYILNGEPVEVETFITVSFKGIRD